MNNTSFTDCSPIFIVGAGRSGTTLLQMMLNAHPNIAIMGELHYFEQILQVKKIVPSLQSNKDLDSLFSLIRKYSGIQHLPDIDNILKAVKLRMHDDNRRSYEKFYKYILEEFAKPKKTIKFGEKTPTNIRFLEQIISIFPNSKIIHIIRDPRDIIASSVKMPWIANDVIVNSLKWKCEILYSDNFQKRKNNYLEVFYEKLVSDPETQLKKICTFVEEEFDGAMLEYYKVSRFFLKNEPWKNGTCKPVNTSAIGRWKRDLTKAQVFIIEKIVGSLMCRFGYKKTKVNIKTKLLTTFVFFHELFKYITYKINEKKLLNQKYPNTSFGKTDGYYIFFLKSFFK